MEYRRALARAVRTPHSRVVPFFGVFIRDLKATLSQTPSIVVVSSNDNAVPILRVPFINCIYLLFFQKDDVYLFLQHLSEHGREDQFLAFGGTGGLLNLEKIRAAQKVLEKIARYQQLQQQEAEKRQKRSWDNLSCSSSNSSDMYV